MTHQIKPAPASLRPLHEPAALTDPSALLDAAHAGLSRGTDVAHCVDVLSDGLWWLRGAQDAAQWRATIDLVRAHPVMALLREDPFVRRCQDKPRGYAGDAPLIDMVYYGQAATEAAGATPLGLAILHRNNQTSGSIAVRERRDYTAGLIDLVAEERPMPNVLAVACGHLREGLESRAVQANAIGRLVALDQDEDSLAIVRRDYGIKGAEPMCRSVKAILDGSLPRQSFDLIYAAGLYDYLQQRFATALTRALFDLLRPGGRLVVGNFAPGIYDVGFMEACMDWFLIYRDAGEVMNLASTIPSAELATRRVFTRQSPDIFYLEVRRRRGG